MDRGMVLFLGCMLTFTSSWLGLILIPQIFLSEEQPVTNLDFDGYRVDFPNWWFNIRPSNTEPYLRFIAEADQQYLLDDKLVKTQQIIAPFLDK